MFLTSWHDNGRTEEPCPKCGVKVHWVRAWDKAAKETRRFLKCLAKKCDWISGSGTRQGGYKGFTEVERFNARAR